MPKKTVLRGLRKTYTKELKEHVARRRLDSLARILSARSECVAVAILGDKTYLSANEIDSSTKEDKKVLKSIKKIKDYFVQSQSKSSEDREDFFTDDICAPSRFSLKLKASPIRIADEIRQEVPKWVISQRGDEIDTLMKQFIPRMAEAGLVYGEAKYLYRDFSKLEKTFFKNDESPNEQLDLSQDDLNQEILDEEAQLESQQKDVEQELEEEEEIEELSTPRSGEELGEEEKEEENLTTNQPASSSETSPASSSSQAAQILEPDAKLELQNLTKLASENQFIISRDETNKNVHAEMKILAYILKNVDNYKNIGNIYIGLNKLCCLQCQYMLEAANEVLKEKGIFLATRGYHGLAFENKWNPPKDFEQGYRESNKLKKGASLQEKIGYKAREKIEMLRAGPKLTDLEKADMITSPSDSDKESGTEEQRGLRKKILKRV